MARLSIDISPLRKSRDFRNLWAAGLVTYFGSMITYVAVPFQIKEMTHSYLAVGLSGLVEILPLIIFGLYGGVLADAVDRKKMVWATEAASLILTSICVVAFAQSSFDLCRLRIICRGQWSSASEYGCGTSEIS